MDLALFAAGDLERPKAGLVVLTAHEEKLSDGRKDEAKRARSLTKGQAALVR